MVGIVPDNLLESGNVGLIIGPGTEIQPLGQPLPRGHNPHGNGRYHHRHDDGNYLICLLFVQCLFLFRKIYGSKTLRYSTPHAGTPLPLRPSQKFCELSGPSHS